MKKSRWKLDFEIGLGMAFVILVASAGLALAAAKTHKVRKIVPKVPVKITAPKIVSPKKPAAKPKPAPVSAKAVPLPTPSPVAHPAPSQATPEYSGNSSDW